jgi:hypothetical protein
MVEESDQGGSPSKLQFHYIKSNHFRVIHADGLLGSITPKDDIFVTFYNERSPLPDYVSFEITPNGEIGKEIEADRVVNSDGVIREMEVGVVFDIDFARSFALWLTEMLQNFENPVVAEKGE